MKRGEWWSARVLMLAWLMSGLMGCSAKSPGFAPEGEPPAVPSLPSEARQPVTPSACSPTCSLKWSEQVENWRQKLTGVE